LKNFRILAFTHKTIDIREIGRFHIEDGQLEKRLLPLKKNSGISELLYLSTCNRVELMMVSHEKPSPAWLREFFKNFNPAWTKKEIHFAEEKVKIYEGEDAVRHLLYVASSIDSLVVGEREIITQVRKAYEVCSQLNLSGDFIRLLVKTTIETAKKIYSDTQIAQRPVSVVSLAYRKLEAAGVKKNSRLLLIGAGQTNTSIAQYLKKENWSSVHVYNRSLENAEKLAKQFNGKAHITLEDLKKHKTGFDVLISCTASAETIVDSKLFSKLVADEKGKKIIVDLAIPADVDDAVAALKNVHYIGIENLKSISPGKLRTPPERIRALQRNYRHGSNGI
jgi:glutamyl-tRNA reductase